DNDLNSMCWPDLLVRAQTKRVTRDVTFNIGKQILISRDAQSRRPTFPFDYECSAGVDLCKCGNRSFFGFNLTVASNSHPPASKGENNAGGQKYRGIFFMGKYCSLLLIERRPTFGFRKTVVL